MKASIVDPLRAAEFGPLDLEGLTDLEWDLLLLAERARQMPDLAHVILGVGVPFVLAKAEVAGAGWKPDPKQPQDAFEAWLVARWLREARSDAFRDSVQGQRLQAQFERGEP